MKNLYLQLNECGSGSIDLPLNTQAATDAIAASFIDLDYRGTILGGFIPERVERVPISESENAGKVVNLSGRGPMAILGNAMVWDWGTPALEKERYFNSVVGGDNFITPMHHKGHILHRLLTEAISYQTNPSGDHMDRYCFHRNSGAYTNDPAAGANIELNMADTSGFTVGDIVTVGSSAGSELATITVVHTNVHITVNFLALDHTITDRFIGIPILSWSFNATQDTDTIPWDVVENEDLRARTGATILELARQYAALGQPTAGKVFDIHAIHLNTGVIDFHIHQTPTGILAANAVVHFKEGGNVQTVSDVEDKTGVRNAAEVAYTDPVYPYVSTSVPASIHDYGRREEVIETYNAETYAQASKFGLAELAGISESTRVITLTISDVKAPQYGTDYNLGDWVYYEDNSYIEIPVRIMTLNLKWDDDIPLTITAECLA